MEASELGSKSGTMRKPKQGGFRGATFILAFAGVENIGFITLMVSLVLYLLFVLHFDLSGAATTVTNFMGATFLLTIVGGFISDTYLTRLNTILIFGFLEIIGYALLTSQAHYAELRPDVNCLSCRLEGGNKRLFILTLCILALGFGGVRGATPALGADQFDRTHPKEKQQLASFFNWLLMFVTIGATLGVTVIVGVSVNKSWGLGFLLCMVFAFLGFVFVAAGKPFYHVRVAGDDSPLVRIVQVIVVAVQNHKLSLPESSGELYEDGLAEEILPRTEQFRWLDRASILPKGTTIPQRWEVCSVTQVEEVKILTQMLPIIASTVLMNTCLAQLQTFSVEQGNMMDLHLGSYKVPPASIPVIPLLFMSILIPIYELLFIPIARRFTGHPTGITYLQRVGVGLVLSSISMATAAMVEIKRKNAFKLHSEQISLFWLSFQFGIFGVADMFTLVGLMEFFYSEAPSGMRSLATSFAWLSMSIGYFMSTVFVHLINHITRRITPSRQGWLHGRDFNSNQLNLFYWFLAILSCINFGVFLLCAKWYKYRNKSLDQVKGGAPASPKAVLAANADEIGDEDVKKGLDGSVVEEDVKIEASKEGEELGVEQGMVDHPVVTENQLGLVER